jgi:CBS domain-containing protein
VSLDASSQEKSMSEPMSEPPEQPAMPQRLAARKVISEALRELTVVSDEARFQIHLFSLEAKRRWNEIEGKLRSLEARVAEGSGGQEMSTATRELWQATRDLLAEQGNPSAPSTEVRRVMNADARSCRPDQSLSEAAQVMAEAECSTLPVVDEHGLLVGMLSEHDICVGAAASGAKLSEMPVAAAMQRDVKSSLPDESIGSAAETMRRHKLRHIPVAEADGRLVGTLCLGDLARQLESHAEPSLDPAWVAATLVNAYTR